MTIHRHAAKRDVNEVEIIKALRDAGATVYPLSAEGVPDLLVGFRDSTYLLEVKAARGQLTEAQEDFMDEWTGGDVFIVRTVEEALKSIGAK